MLFNSLQFVLFLALTLVGYRLVERWRTPRHLLLLSASYLFYASWDPRYLVLILASTLLDYNVGRALARTEDQRARKALLWTSIVGNLSLLGVFKYGNFVLENLEAALGLPMPRVPAELPVGISFYTFQTLSYTIDRYRKTIDPARNLLEFALFVAFFPQLVAGPIVRASQLLPQLAAPPRLDPKAIGEGAFLVASGLFKKMVLGDALAHWVVNPMFAAPDAHNAWEMWTGLWAFFAQVYCDFSGYTDVALGAALMFGFRLPDNFKRPFLARSPLEFWRRWHITLQHWLEDYLYKPLGGSRAGPLRTDFNIVFTFLVGGVWHGANWTFVIMGLFHGVLSALWRRAGIPRNLTGYPALISGFITFNLMAFGTLFLRPMSVEDTWLALSCLLHPMREASGVWTPVGVLLMVVVFGLHVTPYRWKTGLREWFGRAPAFVVALMLLVTGAICSVFAEFADPFVYFQF